MRMISAKKIMFHLFLLGLFSVLTGAVYVFGLYGPTEREVALWGAVEVIVGSLILCTIILYAKTTSVRWLIIIILSMNVILQVLPVILWFLFNGTGISDGIPASQFVASWLYSLPHIIVLLMSMLCIAMLTTLIDAREALTAFRRKHFR